MSINSEYETDWNREELMFAVNLYRKIPFGKICSRNPAVIELAGLLDRTPASVGLKLANLASIDKSISILIYS